MRTIHPLVLGAYQTNCYILHDASSKTCCVIDPGYTPEVILDALDNLGLTLEAILLTHGHFDHVGAVKDLAAETQCRVYLCPEDLSMPPAMTAGALYRTDDLHEGTRLHLAGLDITVLHTPGHTPGSVCFLTEGALFSGDTLFARSCGRMDLPGGSPAQMRGSLDRLRQLPFAGPVYPGHGGATTLAEERRWNPYLKGEVRL